MYNLLESLYDRNKIAQIENLYSHSDLHDQFLIRSTIANALQDSPPRVFTDNGLDWILCTLATHGKSPTDTVRVFQSITRQLHEFTFGIINDEIQFKTPEEIADTCLVSLGFFRSRMEKLHKRHAAPSVNYYTQAGRLAFIRTGFESVGDEFKEWASFIENEFVSG